MKVVTGVPVEENVDDLAFKVFIKSIEILGGPRKLLEYRNLTWVPSLMAASYAVVLRDKKMYSAESIARELGLSTATVKKMLSSDPEEVMRRVRGEIPPEEFDEHIAGGLAKEAWRRIKSGEDLGIALPSLRNTAEALEIPWAVAVLEKLKGFDFPAEGPEDLRERLRGINIEGKDVEELLEHIEYPVNSPAELLRKLKRAASS